MNQGNYIILTTDYEAVEELVTLNFIIYLFIFFQNEEGIPAYRYRLPGNVFASPDKNPDNKCYCKNSACPPCGTFNTAPCNFSQCRF